MSILRRISTIFIALAVLLATQAAFTPARSSALSGNDFNAARIIDDSIFFNSSTMSPSSIQSFLNAKVPNCRAGYTCLKDYVQTYGNTGADAFCGGLGGGTKSAAQIIYEVSVECGVNPQSILVLLQKEQSLVTDTWPEPIQYRSAAGYGCPDTAACDAQYYGFFNQVYRAARQFKRYVQQPGQYNYAAGRTSFISYQANDASCGGTNVTIQNGATAALYNYTPYQPNAPALANLYGLGDRCSAYGNRNFWRMFNDWFGPTNGDLVRTVGNGTVYLISGDKKYPIADQSVLSDFMALGPIRFVSDNVVNSKTTGPTLGHMVGAPNGTLYFVNAGIKLAFPSCDMVVAYGYTCSNIIQLTEGQLSTLATGPYITPYYKTTSGKLFYITGGQKREVFDTQSLTQQSLNGAQNTLLESGLGYLSYGNPVVRNNVIVVNRSNFARFYYENNKYIALNDELANSVNFRLLDQSGLDDISIPSGQRIANFNGFVKNNAANQFYVLTDTGKAALSDPSAWPVPFTTVSDAYLSNGSVNSSGTINNTIIKSSDNGTVYYLADGKKRSISSWEDLLSLQVQPLIINNLSTVSVNAIPEGNSFLGVGTMVKSANSSTVYIVGSSNKIYPISSFVFPQQLGLSTTLRTIADSVIQGYTVDGNNLGGKVVCDSKNYIGNNGAAYEVTAEMMTRYGYIQNQFLNIESSLCRNIPKSSQGLQRFIRSNNGTIYSVESGQKRAYTSYQTYINDGGTGSNTLPASDYLLATLANGTNL